MNIFIHRRDIRIADNTSLYKLASTTKGPVTGIFIFTPEQIDPKKNKYFSNNLVHFMCESLLELREEYRKKGGDLYFFYGDVIDVLTMIHSRGGGISSLGWNVDYSPYSKKRDKRMVDWCVQNSVTHVSEEDMLLVDIVNNKNYPNETPYKVFTPFMRYQQKMFAVKGPQRKRPSFATLPKNVINDSLYIDNILSFFTPNPHLHVVPGRNAGKKVLLNLKKQKKYDECRNMLTYETSNLSAYINLGLVSIREVYNIAVRELGVSSGFVTELYWRDFYYNVLYHNPRVVGNSFKPAYDNIPWENDKKKFKAWCEGKTGVPIVDACMRQLNTTGYMHNRGRMIVASFLTKDLLIDWRWGERYFATQLVDYNVSANNGGWQWAAGSGTDAQPYFRIFNPYTQADKFDPKGEYVRKWIGDEVIHGIGHDHASARKNTIALFKNNLN